MDKNQNYSLLDNGLWHIPEIPEMPPVEPLSYKRWIVSIGVTFLVTISSVIALFWVEDNDVYSLIALISGAFFLFLLVLYYIKLSIYYHKQKQYTSWEEEKKNIHVRWEHWAQEYWHLNDYTLIFPDNIDINKLLPDTNIITGKIRNNFALQLMPFAWLDVMDHLFKKRYDKKEEVIEKILNYHIPLLNQLPDGEKKETEILVLEDIQQSELDKDNRRLGEDTLSLVKRLANEQCIDSNIQIRYESVNTYSPYVLMDWMNNHGLKHKLLLVLSINHLTNSEAACSLFFSKTLSREEDVKLFAMRPNYSHITLLKQLLQQTWEYQLVFLGQFNIWVSGLDSSEYAEIVNFFQTKNINLLSDNGQYMAFNLDTICGALHPIHSWMNLAAAVKSSGNGSGHHLSISKINDFIYINTIKSEF